MPGKRSSDLVAARKGLLDAIEALERHKDALVLVGAQAVYMWTDHICPTSITKVHERQLLVCIRGFRGAEPP